MFTPALFVAGASNVILGLRRAFRGIGFRGARDLALLPVTPIATATSGRRKFIGKAHGTGHVQSLVNAVPCIAHRHVTWSQTSGNTVLRETTWTSFPFELDDGSGQKLAVDPKSAILDYETVSLPDAGRGAEEQYLRDGDSLAVVADVEVDTTEGYRDHAGGRVRIVGAPLVSWRSEPEVLPKVVPGLAPSVMTALGAAGMAWGFVALHGEKEEVFMIAVLVVSALYGAVHAFGGR